MSCWDHKTHKLYRDSKACADRRKQANASRTALVNRSAVTLRVPASTPCWAQWASRQRRPSSRWCTRPWTRRAGCGPKPWRQISTPPQPASRWSIHESSIDSDYRGLIIDFGLSKPHVIRFLICFHGLGNVLHPLDGAAHVRVFDNRGLVGNTGGGGITCGRGRKSRSSQFFPEEAFI